MPYFHISLNLELNPISHGLFFHGSNGRGEGVERGGRNKVSEPNSLLHSHLSKGWIKILIKLVDLTWQVKTEPEEVEDKESKEDKKALVPSRLRLDHFPDHLILNFFRLKVKVKVDLLKLKFIFYL